MRKILILVTMLVLSICLFGDEDYALGRLILKTYSTIDTIYTNQNGIVQIDESWFDSIAVEYEMYDLYPIVENPATSSLEKIYICEFPDSIACEMVITELEKEKDNVAYALLDLKLVNFFVPDDHYYSSQWNLEKIGMEEVWGHHLWDDEINVAVYDSGIDCADPGDPTTLDVHPDLIGQILTDGQGNMIYYTPEDEPVDNLPYDDDSHGTYVSGIINTLTDNDEGVASICGLDSYVKILPMKCSETSFLSALIDALNWLYWGLYWQDFHVEVLNISMGVRTPIIPLQHYLDLCAIIHDLITDHDLIIIAAAGNDGEDSDINLQYAYIPSGIEGVLRISSSNSEDYVSSFSNYGSDVFVAAPGTSVISTVPHYVGYGCSDNPYEFHSGTSASAPHVSGMLAFMKSHYTNLDNADIFEIINKTNDDLVLTPYQAGKVGSGRINIKKAMEINLNEVNPNFVLSHLDFEGEPILNNFTPPIEVNLMFKNFGDDLTNVEITGEFSCPNLTFNIVNGTHWENNNGVFEATHPLIQENLVTVSFGSSNTRNTMMTFVFTATDINTQEEVYCDTLYADVQLYYTGIEFYGIPITDLLIDDLDNDGIDEVLYGQLNAIDHDWHIVEYNNGDYFYNTTAIDSICLKPVAADLDNDGIKEVVIATQDGDDTNIIVMDDNLDVIQTIDMTEHIMFGLALEDLDDDGDLEIITNVHYGATPTAAYDIIFDPCSNPYRMFVPDPGYVWHTALATANLNNDLVKEAVAIAEDNNQYLCLRVLTITLGATLQDYDPEINSGGEIPPHLGHVAWHVVDPVLAKNVDSGNIYHYVFVHVIENAGGHPQRNLDYKLYCYDTTAPQSYFWCNELSTIWANTGNTPVMKDLVIGDFTDDAGLEILVPSKLLVIDVESGTEIQDLYDLDAYPFPINYNIDSFSIADTDQNDCQDIISVYYNTYFTGITTINANQQFVGDKSLYFPVNAAGDNVIYSGAVGWNGNDYLYYYLDMTCRLTDMDLDMDLCGFVEWSQRGENARNTYSYYQPIPEEISEDFTLFHDAKIDYDIEVTNAVGIEWIIEPGTEIRVERNKKIINYGIIEASSDSESEPVIITGICSESVPYFWLGINSMNASDIYFINCEYANAQGLNLNGSGTRKLHMSNIHNNKNGIYAYNNACAILYGSSIEDNDIAGLGCFNNSSLVMGPYSTNNHLGYNNVNNNDYGIESFGSSFTLGNGYNNFDQTNNSYNIKLTSSFVSPPINVEENWWGSTQTHVIESLFNYPLCFDYDPYSLSINQIPTRTGEFTPLEEAMIAFTGENYSVSISLCEIILTDSLYTWEDFAGLNCLFLSYCAIENLSELELWLSEFNSIMDSEFELAIERIYALIHRSNQEYENAIAIYEEILMNNPTYEDSCYCIIDIGDTYFESGANIRSDQLRNIPSNFDSFLEFKYDLLESFGRENSNGSDQIIPPVTLQAIYPNPFNPDTNIKFTLSKELPVRIDI